MSAVAVPTSTSDPTEATLPRPNAFARWALGYIIDPRDLPFVTLIASASVVLFPAAAYLFVPGRFSDACSTSWATTCP